jgi:hypothetical protein
MYISNQHRGGYQALSGDPKNSTKVTTAAAENIAPVTGGLKTDAVNSVSKAPSNSQNIRREPQLNQHNQINGRPQRQPLPQDFDFAKAASSGINNQTVYDKPSGANRFAIDSYQQIVNGPKREEIQRLVGIDTFV